MAMPGEQLGGSRVAILEKHEWLRVQVTSHFAY